MYYGSHRKSLSSTVRPGCDLRGSQRREARLVAAPGRVIEEFAPVPSHAAAEKLLRLLPDIPARIRGEVCGADAHTLKRGGFHQSAPSLLPYLDIEPCREATHLSFAIRFKIAI